MERLRADIDAAEETIRTLEDDAARYDGQSVATLKQTNAAVELQSQSNRAAGEAFGVPAEQRSSLPCQRIVRAKRHQHTRCARRYRWARGASGIPTQHLNSMSVRERPSSLRWSTIKIETTRNTQSR